MIENYLILFETGGSILINDLSDLPKELIKWNRENEGYRIYKLIAIITTNKERH